MMKVCGSAAPFAVRLASPDGARVTCAALCCSPCSEACLTGQRHLLCYSRGSASRIENEEAPPVSQSLTARVAAKPHR